MIWQQESYSKAFRFAARAHQGQRITGTDLPYLMHLSLVSMEVIAAVRAEPGRDEELAVQCALLHDVIEDTAVDYEAVRARFGETVAQGVLALSKDQTLAKADQMPDSLRRIQQQPPEVWLVKLADRITNLAPPPAHWSKEKIARYRQEAIIIYEALHPASPYLGRRLQEKIQAYRRFE